MYTEFFSKLERARSVNISPKYKGEFMLRDTTTLLAFLLLPTFLCIGASASAFQASGNCNDMDRSVSIEGGTKNSADTPCGTVAIGTFTSPAACKLGYNNTSQNIYSCSGALEDNNCDPRGYQATVTIASGGKCPSFVPDFEGIELSADTLVKDIPVAVFKAFACVPPALKSTQEPSAKVTACAGDSDHPATIGYQPGSSIGFSDGSLAIVSPTSLVGGDSGIEAPLNLFLDDYERAQTGTPEELSGAMGVLAQAQAGLHAGRITATVEVSHWSANEIEPSSTYRVRLDGSIALDGRFDYDRSIEGTEAGDLVQIDHRTTYNSAQLMDYSELGEIGNVYNSSPGIDPRILEVHIDRIGILHDWLRAPYSIPLFPGGVDYQETTLSNGNLLLTRSHPLSFGSTESFVGEEYELVTRNGTSLPIRRTERDARGVVWAEYIYSDFIEFQPGDWRPTKTVHTRILDGSPTGDRIVTETYILRAFATSEEPFPPIPGAWDDGLLWQVWQ